MSEEILDKEYQPKARSYKIVRIGILSGIISIVSMCIGLGILYLSKLNTLDEIRLLTVLIILFSLLLPILGGMFLIAAWGGRKRHFLRILTTGLIGYQTTLLIMVLIDIAKTIYNPSAIHNPYFGGMFNGNLLIVLFAFILWLIPGKLPYFRKQVEG